MDYAEISAACLGEQRGEGLEFALRIRIVETMRLNLPTQKKNCEYS